MIPTTAVNQVMDHQLIVNQTHQEGKSLCQTDPVKVVAEQEGAIPNR